MPDCYKHELSLQGVFRADLVVGCTSAKHFVLVEFEGGTRNSIFSQRRRTAQLRDWSSEIQHAFSQVSDWTWAKNDNQHSDVYRNIFGLDHFDETYLVICGRKNFLDRTEQSRFHWRSTKTMVASCHIRFWTYDDLYVQTSAQLDAWRYAQRRVLARCGQ
jgi:Domain of unknown function (DUF4263)